jgi:nucleoside-diphosphate-sugar epimerase
MAATALVTGASGLVGRALVAALRARGETVVAFAGDVTDAGAVTRALAEHAPAVVFHLAARAVDGDGDADPDATWRVNVGGTRAVLAAAAGGPRVVVASSVAAYAPVAPGTAALVEDLPLLAPDDPVAGAYARSKAAADALARAAGATVARFTNIYGAGDRHASRLVPELAAAVAQGRAPRLRSDGTARLDLLHAGDAAGALIALAQAAPAGEAYNIGAGEDVAVRDVVSAAERAAGRSLHAVYGSARPAAERPPVSIAKVAAATGWRPATSLDEGLRRTLA